MTSRPLGGIGARIAAAALAVATVAIGILAVGVLVLGAATFTQLMVVHGESTAASQAMFDDSVARIFLVAVVVAVVASIGLAVILGPRLARPLREMGAAARRIAAGDYRARIARQGPEEIAGLADSFNQMAASLEEQERFRRDFIANAAHELRTPLTNLRGYLEALRDGVIPPERATFESLWDEVERLMRLSASLDTLTEGDARVAAPAATWTDLAEAIRAALDLARPAIRAAGLELEVDVPARLPVRADPDHLAQVMANLLQNAVRYTPVGGHVTVRADARPGGAVATVANTGPGIPADDLPRVFERFFRVERSRDRASGGAGIGLAIVRELVESNGGAVGAESRDGLTRVWFSLPS